MSLRTESEQSSLPSANMDPRQRSTLSDTNSSASGNTAHSDRSQCVVCMDAPTDITLSPCRHAHCCLNCFRRSSLRTCPVCRSVVTSIIVQSTGVQLPFNPPPSASTSESSRQPSRTPSPQLSRMNANIPAGFTPATQATSHSTHTYSNIMHARPFSNSRYTANSFTRIPSAANNWTATGNPATNTFADNSNVAVPVRTDGGTTFVRRSTRLDFEPPPFHRYRHFRANNNNHSGGGGGGVGASRSAGSNTLHVRSVARQAPRGTGRATSRREATTNGRTGSAVRSAGPSTLTAHSQPELQSVLRTRSSMTSVSCAPTFFSEPNRSPPPHVDPPPLLGQPKECIVLIGNSRVILVALARKLTNAFPPPKNDAAAAQLKSTIFIHGDPIRLVLIDSTPFSMRSELAARIYRHAPNLILLCSDYTNVASFEAVIRLDMEILDYLQFPCMWVLIKTGVISSRKKRRNVMNFVDESDLRIAKHFIASERQSLIVSVDTSSHTYSNIKKLGALIQRSIGRPDADQPADIYRRTPALSSSLLGLWTTFSNTRQPNGKKRHPVVNLGQCWNRSLAI